jgi:hypothetical protein
MKPLPIAALCLGLLCAAPVAAQTCPGRAALPSPQVIEIARFRLADGVATAAFRAAARASMAFLCDQEGFAGRSLSRDESGLWTDHVGWTSLDAAKAAAEAAMSDPTIAPFMAAIDADTLSFAHGEAVPLE